MNQQSTINCITVRRLLLTHPTDLDADVLQHLANCQACKKTALEANAFDNVLLTTLNVPVPTGLADRILLTKGIHEKLQTHKTRHRYQTIAASIVLAVGILATFFFPAPDTRIGDIALAHVNDEPHHLQDRKNIKLAQLNKIISPFNMQIKISPQRIHYAGTCKIRRSTGVHIVIQGKKAPLTILLMPGEQVSKRLTIHNKDFNGIILPVKNGSIAIIGDKQEDLDAVGKQIIEQLVITQGSSNSFRLHHSDHRRVYSA